MSDDLGYDLSLISASLSETSGARGAFKAAVKRLAAVQAEVLDLERVLRLLALLDERAARRTTGDFDSPSEGDTTFAWYVSAVILYTRATENRGQRLKHKPPPVYADRYSAQALSAHSAIMKIRDDGLAHWGPGLTREGAFHNEMSVELHGDMPAFRFRYLNWHERTSDKLKLLIAEALPIASDELRNAGEAAIQAFRVMLSNCPSVRPLAEACRKVPRQSDSFAHQWQGNTPIR